jgi:hypothetical protein
LFDGKELSRDEKCVRGTFVTGLSESDILFLDRFEGEGFVGSMSLARWWRLLIIVHSFIDASKLMYIP